MLFEGYVTLVGLRKDKQEYCRNNVSQHNMTVLLPKHTTISVAKKVNLIKEVINELEISLDCIIAKPQHDKA